MEYVRIINSARGLEKADLVIKNAGVVNVLTDEIYKADIAITDGVIAGVGNDYSGIREIDARGKFVTPSFIDGHVHLESSMLMPSEFAKLVVPCGTTTVIADPHEISNVLGLHGISFLKNAVEGLPLDVYCTLPSCVPATGFETSGFDLQSYDLSMLIDRPWVLGLAEMMNFTGVLNNDPVVLSKIDLARQYNKRIDGHAPQLTGKDLCAYAAAGVASDHECTTTEEAVEKLRLGMYLMIREGTAAKDLEALIPVLLSCNTDKCLFVTDDRHPHDLKPHINGMVKMCVKAGLSPVKAVRIASLNTAEYFGLKNLGAIAPGYKADLLILPDLDNFEPELVLKNGNIVAQDGKLLYEINSSIQGTARGSVNVRWIERSDFKIEAGGDNKSPVARVNAIQVIPNQLITKIYDANVNIINGYAEPNLDDDILKICVIERHRASGNIGRGFVRGFNLKSGAIASTVAHDSHNMVIIGTNDEDMYRAAVRLIKLQGGKVVVNNGEILAELPLPIAGLISDRDYEYVINQCDALNNAAAGLGCTLNDPFMAMGFLSLPVIPEIKITDKGVFDTGKFDFIDIFSETGAVVK